MFGRHCISHSRVIQDWSTVSKSEFDDFCNDRFPRPSNAALLDPPSTISVATEDDNIDDDILCEAPESVMDFSIDDSPSAISVASEDDGDDDDNVASILNDEDDDDDKDVDNVASILNDEDDDDDKDVDNVAPVSYTHLTLPTKA